MYFYIKKGFGPYMKLSKILWALSAFFVLSQASFAIDKSTTRTTTYVKVGGVVHKIDKQTVVDPVSKTYVDTWCDASCGLSAGNCSGSGCLLNGSSCTAYTCKINEGYTGNCLGASCSWHQKSGGLNSGQN